MSDDNHFPSAQPTHELVEAAEHACNVLAELYAKYQIKIGPFASQAQAANVRLRAALAAAPAATQPEGQEALETRADGVVVRKDRWEFGIRRIVALLWGNRREFEVDEVVEAVRALVRDPHTDDEALVHAVSQLAACSPSRPGGRWETMKGYAVVVLRRDGSHYFAMPGKGFATPVFFTHTNAMQHARDLREHDIPARVVKVEYSDPVIIGPKRYVDSQAGGGEA